MSGLCARALAIERPERVRRLVLVGSPSGVRSVLELRATGGIPRPVAAGHTRRGGVARPLARTAARLRRAG
jgi:pimeloyl-ACP methyl ester carboxylesterase